MQVENLHFSDAKMGVKGLSAFFYNHDSFFDKVRYSYNLGIWAFV